ncbi:MAG: hypothetical protein ABIP48_08395, partial [Planctomycetota bacterium]
VSENVSSGADPSGNFRQALIDRFYKPENLDLLAFFNPANEGLPINPWYFDASSNFINTYSNGDVDGTIEQVLIRAATQSGIQATDAQLGRLRALLDEVAGLLRGEDQAVMFSRFDADPNLTNTVLFSDSVANAERDGQNRRYLLTIPTTATGGTFVVRVYHPNATGFQDVTISPVYVSSTLQVGQTRDAIEAALRGSNRTGVNWPYNWHEGPVDVRVVSNGFGSISSEVTARTGTPWAYTVSPNEAVFEIVFQGEVHDEWISFYLLTNSLTPDPQPSPRIITHTYPDEGTRQTQASIAVEPDGDIVMAWTQYEEFTSGGTSNRNIYYRRFTEDTDTAGPRLSDLSAAAGMPLADGGSLASEVTHLVMTFDEDMLAIGDDSVLNPENYRLLASGIEIDGGIAQIRFGMNLASQLAGQTDPITGLPYDVSPIATNKWEAVITVDRNGVEPGVEPLGAGLYTVEALAPIDPTPTTFGSSGLRDKAGNPLGHTGFQVGGFNFSRDFIITATGGGGGGGGGGPDGLIANPGRTFPESAQAVAVDADGDYAVVWTSPDATFSTDRVFIKLFNANGTPAATAPASFPVVPFVPNPSDPNFFFNGSDQRYATVAADKDGDFIVTWTNYRDGGTETDIYARRFQANGTALGAPFLVNTYGAYGTDSQSNQKWSHVAMDADGEFVISWSSYGQEDNGQLGSGYGIYARRYDSIVARDQTAATLPPQPLGPEFQVNVTTGGNQQFSSVDMDAEGGFVIAWTSDQNGVGDDIIARVYNSDGSPAASPLTGEILVNATTAGHQRYPNVATDLSGDNFVVTWSSSGQDGEGWGVYARAFQRPGTPATGDLLVNTTTTGNQMFSSVAINHLGDALGSEGDFTVTWSGYGDQAGEDDMAGYGIFAQRFQFDGTPEGATLAEKRINNIVPGNQWLPSIDTDGEGNFVIVWTGPGTNPGETGVYHFVSFTQPHRWPVFDSDGPIVTDVINPSDPFLSRVLDGDVLAAGIQQLTVVFGEKLSTVGGATGLNSVLNPSNWALERNGTEIVAGIAGVTFGRNDFLSRKYEALLTLDGNGLDSGLVALPDGDYVLTVRDLITDGLNSLDGDFDGVPGTDPGSTGQPGFQFHFTVDSQAQLGAEFRVNSPDATGQNTTPYDQRFAAAFGTGTAREESTRSVAVDHDGDFVVVWTSYGQDDAADSKGAGV